MADMTVTPSTQAFLNKIDDSNEIEKAFYSNFLNKADALDAEIRDQSKAMNQSREDIGKLNELLAALRTAEKSNPNASVDTLSSNSAIKAVLAKYPELGSTLSSALDKLGVSKTGTDGSALNLANPNGNGLAAIETNLKTKLNSLNNTSQEDLFRLQQNTNQLTQLYELMTNFMSKMGNALQGILGNVRS